METKVQMFVDVNQSGEIVNAQMGANIVATDPFAFFFMLDQERANYVFQNIANFRVEIDGLKPQLVEVGESNE